MSGGARAAVPRLLAITQADCSEPRGAPGYRFEAELEAWLAALDAAGVDGVQVRRKELADRALLALVERVLSALPRSTSVLVNGRLDVAIAAGAAGVHLPACGLPTAEVRRLAQALGVEALVGRSAHHPDEVARARDEGADYATFGPVWATPAKAHYGEPPGLAGLERACAHGLPVLALGGVDRERFAEAAAAGAAGAAGIRMFQRPEGLGATVEAARWVFGGG